MPSTIIRNLLTGESANNKTFDTPAYEKALKESGYTDEEARAYWNPRQDPFSQESLDDYASSQAPKVTIENGTISISAPKEVLDSPFTKQLQKELGSLKGVDLNNTEVANAINKLNQEIQANFSASALESLGWTEDEWNNYQRAVQTTSSSNPMKSGDYLAWGPDGNPLKDEKGEIIMKTPEEWVKYWKENYNADERTELFKKSFQSSKPYERTMALVMAGPGGTTPVYGYSEKERFGEAYRALQSEMGKFPEGLFRLLVEDNDTKRVEGIVGDKRIPVESMRKFNISTEEQFEEKKKSLEGKSWGELSDDDKAFLVLLGVSREGELEKGIDATDAMEGYRGSKTNIFAWDTNKQDYERAKRKATRRISTEDLNNAISDNEEVSRAAIGNILSDNSFDKYKTARNNYDTWQGYQDWMQEDDEEIARNAIWSGVASNFGRVVGTIGRFLWENAVVQGLTGGISAKSLLDPKLATGGTAKTLAGKGFSMNRISDNIGAKLVSWITAKNIPLLSNLSQNTLTFVGNLLGTVPEDILQTAVDNVVTYNVEENKNLINPTQMSENFRNNLIIMTLFNALKAGWGSVRTARLAKKMEKLADLDTPLDVNSVVSDADDLVRAMAQGQDIAIDNDGVSVVDADGNKKTLNNITPEQGKMAQQSLFDYGNTAEALQNRFSQKISLDKDGNIDFEEFKKTYIMGDDPSPEAQQALSDYQNETPVNVRALNRYLREAGGETPESPDSKAGLLDQDLANAFTHKVAPGGVVTYSGLTDETLIDRFKNANVGDKVNIDTYLSTSAKPNVAQLFVSEMPEKVILRVYASDGTPVAYMPQDISPRGDALMENEILYPNDQDVTVIAKYNGDNLGEGYEGATVVDVLLDDSGTVLGPKITFDEGGAAVSEGIETEVPKATVEVETPDGIVRVETPDYQFKDRSDVLITNPQPTQAALTQYHNRGLETLMDEFTNTHLPEFQNKFGDVQASDFDWALWNTKQGLTPEQIVGTTDPTTGRTFTQNMKDAIAWFGEQPFMKELRLASRGAQGLEGDFNLFGYLPHTTYDPSNVSFEEALNGRGSLWEQFTGASMMDENNNYKGFGGDFNSRYRTFASNMLWDAKAKDIAASKVIEEAQMEGIDLTPEQAVKVADGAEAIQEGVDNATTTKDFVKGLSSDGDTDFAEISKRTTEDAKNLGLGESIHDNWSEVYPYQSTSRVTKQRRGFVNSLDTQANFLRNTQTIDGSMYDNGAADMVYAYGNAADIVSRYMDPNDASATNLREALVEYYTKHGRPEKYAEIYADKAMARLGEVPGQLTKAKTISSLANSMKWEAWSKLRRWLVRADYSQFNTSTKKYIDQFLFNHMQMESIQNNPTISQKLTKALETATGLRYRAIFYGNLKNALLQTSELNRYFSAFKWGDVAQMVKRLATDDSFRARVNTYADIVAPGTSRIDADLYGKYSNLADNMEVEQNGVKFKDLGKKAVETADAIGLAPIEKAEAFKNRMMIAGLVQEADRLGLSGDEALRHIRKRFERVALAVDEMGRIGLSSNPLARTMLFLQNFQIRELGMHLYNIIDETDMASSTPKKIINATKYLTKVLGAKLATTLILARLGYSASQTLGLDPFGLLDNYNQMDKEDMNWVDQQIAGGLLTPFFSGGMTSLIGDMYFMSRKAYEESKQRTVSDEAEERVDDTWGLAIPDGLFTWENMMEGAKNFIPGNTFVNRISQMNQLLDTGWATSATGNKMYTAPSDPLNIILGYLFGRSATQNAMQYNQMYGDNLLQTIGRFNPFRDYQEFDPIDTKNYSDWFKGDRNDLQQFNKGRYWFQNERDRIIDEYQAVIGKSYASSEEISEAQNNMNRKLDDLYDKLERFVAAYEKKNGTITPAMVKQILSVLNTGRNIAGETAEQRKARQDEERSKAIERYSQLGLSPIGTYTGPSVDYPDTEAKYQGSPQYRAAVSGYYDIADEAVKVLKLADEELSPIRKEIQSRLSYAYSTEDWDTIEDIQRDYLEQFDQVVAPIIASYGNSILSSTDVANQLNDMLSTGTNKRSGNLIPSSTYAKNKKGRYQSMPYERVDVGKWAQQRYGGNTYKQPTITSWSTVEEDLEAIRNLANSGRMRRARTRALELKARVDSQERSLNKEDYNWLMEFLNKGVNE